VIRIESHHFHEHLEMRSNGLTIYYALQHPVKHFFLQGNL